VKINIDGVMVFAWAAFVLVLIALYILHRTHP